MIKEEDKSILLDIAKEHDVPQEFLFKVLTLEEEYLFQLKRRNVIKKIEKLLIDFSEE